MHKIQIYLLLIGALGSAWKNVLDATRILQFDCATEDYHWQCQNGECISINVLCDGIKHCPDGSDETRRSCENAICTPLSFRCDYGACIPLIQLCDGVVDCADSSDEGSEMCQKRREEISVDESSEQINERNCVGWGQLKCWSGQCVSVHAKCNGIRDCQDGSDEWERLCANIKCNRRKQFQCNYGACISLSAKCNGTAECWDESDETLAECVQKVKGKSDSDVSREKLKTHPTTLITTTQGSVQMFTTQTNAMPISTTTILDNVKPNNENDGSETHERDETELATHSQSDNKKPISGIYLSDVITSSQLGHGLGCRIFKHWQSSSSRYCNDKWIEKSDCCTLYGKTIPCIRILPNTIVQKECRSSGSRHKCSKELKWIEETY
ncbi:low-density lipoprotein receptor-related protein 4-like [Anastrepha ludens]|uniref:low-density lipoprotein receptor-related protein 4-like n=1 Tax=Anastrepha ludens TaxID=28586 RepID=UPI0023AF6107|nr:low-density lipoprotein receptor-related protein 4-like [Anastrepha ludens]